MRQDEPALRGEMPNTASLSAHGAWVSRNSLDDFLSYWFLLLLMEYNSFKKFLFEYTDF